eukprot:1156469-Pelagomonas_calceolata.AAC.5
MAHLVELSCPCRQLIHTLLILRPFVQGDTPRLLVSSLPDSELTQGDYAAYVVNSGPFLFLVANEETCFNNDAFEQAKHRRHGELPWSRQAESEPFGPSFPP